MQVDSGQVKEEDAEEIKPKDDYLGQVSLSNIIADGKRKRGTDDGSDPKILPLLPSVPDLPPLFNHPHHAGRPSFDISQSFTRSGRTGTPTIENRLRDPDFVRKEGRRMFNMLKNHVDILGRNYSHEFLTLPHREMFPDYYEFIKKPIAFDEIRAKLGKDEYKDLDEIERDFTQIFVNAKRYNQKGSAIFNDAKELHKKLKSHWVTLTGRAIENDEDEEGHTSKRQRRERGAGPNLRDWLLQKLQKVVDVRDQTGRSYCEFFLELPPPDLYADYYAVIKQPMAFDMIKNKIKRRDYTTVADFVKDVEQIFTNAKFYNEDGSRVYKDAQTLETFFVDLMKEPPPDFQTATISGLTGNKLTIKLPTAAQAGSTGQPSGASAAPETSTSTIIPEFDTPIGRTANVPRTAASSNLPSALSVPQSAKTPSQLLSTPAAAPPAANQLTQIHTQSALTSNFSPLTPLPNLTPTYPASSPYAIAVAQAQLAGTRKKTTKVLVKVPADQASLIAAFHVRMMCSYEGPTLVLNNTLLRQHTVTVNRDVELIEITASASIEPWAEAWQKEQPDGGTEAPAPLRIANGGRRATKFSPKTRPLNIDLQEHDLTDELDGPDALIKYTIKPADFLNTVEIIASTAGSTEPELYRLFFLKAGR